MKARWVTVIALLVVAGCTSGDDPLPGGSGGGSGGSSHPSAGGSSNAPAGGSSTATGGSAGNSEDGDTPTRPDASFADRSAMDRAAADAFALPNCDAVKAHMRADLALDSMLAGFWNTGNKYFDAMVPSNGKSTGYWTFAQAFDAVLDGAERTGGLHYADRIAVLYAGQNAKGWSSNYYDDENWMALALIRAFDRTGERAYLDRAVTLYQDITAAWDATSAHPGGIWWNRAHTQKATASNAGPVITGARLAARTGDQATLTFARQVYEFWFGKMVDPATYKLADHILPDGTVARGLLTYNEGLMAGAALALYQANGEKRFFDDAHGIAHALIKNETKMTAAGPVLHDGTNASCVGDCPQWKGIGYRYLSEVFRSDPTKSEYRTVLEASVEAAWTLARNPATGFFANDWAGPPLASAAIEAQSSTAMALNLFAMLCGPYAGAP